MVQPSPSYTVALYLEVPASQKAVARLVDTATATGAIVTGVDVADADGDKLTVNLTADTRDSKHRNELVATLEEIDGVVVRNVGDSTFLTHVGGKIEVAGKYPIHNRRDLARVYTPGVARVCKAIYDHPERARMLTIKKNTVAVVTDGTAVLGMGDIGPSAAMPVMEGKAVLFKQFGNVDAWPVALDTKDPEEIISIVKAIAPAYGGINLEDIAAPKCFDIEARLREELDIPVFHDDQHGTAIVTLAALINALKIVDKRIEDVRIVLSGVGAAGSAIAKLLMAHGATDIVGYGRSGALSATNTEGMNEHRKWLAENTNPRQVTGSLKEGLKGADVFIGVSSGNLLEPEDLQAMNDGAIVFAMANTTPVQDNAGVVEQVLRLGREAGWVDVQPVGAVSAGLAGEHLSDMGAMATSAARVRVFSDDGKCVSDPVLMRRSLEYVKSFDGVIAQHAQDPRLTEGSQMHEGVVSAELGLRGWPAVAEESIIARDVLLAEHVGSRLHVCHLSTAGSVEIIRWAKSRGINVTAEVTPHHLLLTDEMARTYSPLYKVNPPLRTAKDVEAVREALADGTIDVVGTDHAPHPVEDKDCEWQAGAFGMTGLETALSVLIETMVSTGCMTWRDIARTMSSAPARIGRLSDQGCELEVGAPANITVVNPEVRRTVDGTAQWTASTNTPYAGMELPGQVMATFLHGRPTVLDGAPVEAPAGSAHA